MKKEDMVNESSGAKIRLLIASFLQEILRVALKETALEYQDISKQPHVSANLAHEVFITRNTMPCLAIK